MKNNILKISDKVGKAYVFAFAATVLVINPISAALCLTLFDIYYIVLVMMIVMLNHNDSLNKYNRYCKEARLFFTKDCIRRSNRDTYSRYYRYLWRGI